MTESINPGKLEEPDYDQDASFEQRNQVVIHMASGRKHRVEFAVRSTQPDAEWLYASRVVNIDDEGYIETNDVVLRAEQVESIESDEIASETFDGGSHIIHYGRYDVHDLAEGWKANNMFGLEEKEPIEKRKAREESNF